MLLLARGGYCIGSQELGPDLNPLRGEEARKKLSCLIRVRRLAPLTRKRNAERPQGPARKSTNPQASCISFQGRLLGGATVWGSSGSWFDVRRIMYISVYAPNAKDV